MSTRPAKPAWLEGAVELGPGQAITLEALESSVSDRVYRSRIEEMAGDTAYVLAPVERSQEIALPLESRLRVGVRVGAMFYGFESSVVEHVFHPQLRLGISVPDVMTRRDQRAFYRLPMVTQPKSAYLLDEREAVEREVRATLVNLSGGGVELVVPEVTGRSRLLSLRLALGDSTLETLAQTVAVDAPGEGRFNYRLHCEFVDLERRQRERIVRFVFREQIDLLRRGMLEVGA